MRNVQYVGPADHRVFSAADLKRLGVEDAKKLSFQKSQPVEVDPAVAEVLLQHADLDGEFQEAGQGEGQETSDAPDAAAKSRSTGTPSGRGTTTGATNTASTRSS